VGAKEPWHAVSIVCGPACCAPASSLGDRRFLSAEAPQLPLENCSMRWRCTCTYKHFPDRRSRARRETDRGMFPRPHLAPERRTTAGRRATDIDE